MLKPLFEKRNDMSTVIGSQQGDSEKTPTLRQYLQRVGKVPARCYVKTIFLPSKTGSYGLVCDPGFRISIPESSPLFVTFRTMFEDIHEQSLCLFVHVSDPDRCYWQLEACDLNVTEWDVTDWGLRSTELAKPVSKRERAASQKGRSRTVRSTEPSGTAGSSLNGSVHTEAR